MGGLFVHFTFWRQKSYKTDEWCLRSLKQRHTIKETFHHKISSLKSFFVWWMQELMKEIYFLGVEFPFKYLLALVRGGISLFWKNKKVTLTFLSLQISQREASLQPHHSRNWFTLKQLWRDLRGVAYSWGWGGLVRYLCRVFFSLIKVWSSSLGCKAPGDGPVWMKPL